MKSFMRVKGVSTLLLLGLCLNDDLEVSFLSH